MRLVLIVSPLLALAACAAPTVPEVPVVASTASGAVVAQQTCHRETKTGSNMYQTVCESTSDSDRQGSIDGIHKMAGTAGAGNGFSHGN